MKHYIPLRRGLRFALVMLALLALAGVVPVKKQHNPRGP